MEKNRQKTESTQCQPEMQSAGASTQPTLNQHPLKEYSKYVTFNVMGMIGVSCYIFRVQGTGCAGTGGAESGIAHL